MIVGKPEGVNAYEFSMFISYSVMSTVHLSWSTVCVILWVSNTESWILLAILDDLLHMYRSVGCEWSSKQVRWQL